MDGDRTEACGRCSMTTVVDVAGGDAADADGDAAPDDASDPFVGGHIEVEESAVRAVSPSAWLGGVRRGIDGLVTRLVYGK